MPTVREILPRDATARLLEYRRAVMRAVPEVERLVLFGSRARGDARDDSDYDVAVLVRNLPNRRLVRRLLSDLAYDHILEGFFIRPIALPSQALAAQSVWPSELAEDIAREGVEIA